MSAGLSGNGSGITIEPAVIVTDPRSPLQLPHGGGGAFTYDTTGIAFPSGLPATPTASRNGDADLLDPNLVSEAKSRGVRPSDVYKHLSRGMAIIAGYAATALFIFSALALGLTPIGWAAIGTAAIILLIVFIALRQRALKQEGVQSTDTLKEIGKNIITIPSWPLAILFELRDFFGMFKRKNDDIPAPGPNLFSEDDDPEDTAGQSNPHDGIAIASPNNNGGLGDRINPPLDRTGSDAEPITVVIEDGSALLPDGGIPRDRSGSITSVDLNAGVARLPSQPSVRPVAGTSMPYPDDVNEL